MHAFSGHEKRVLREGESHATKRRSSPSRHATTYTKTVQMLRERNARL